MFDWYIIVYLYVLNTAGWQTLKKKKLCIMYTRESSWNSDFNTVETDRPQHDRSAVSVIAQQYSSATFVSWHLHYSKEKNRCALQKKKVTILILFCTNSVRQKLHNFQLRQTVQIYCGRTFYTNSQVCSFDAGKSRSGTTGRNIEVTRHH